MTARAHKTPVVVDLFSGTGGLSLGAARAGFSVGCAVEIDPHATAAHRTNFPRTTHIEASVASLSGRQLLSRAGIKRSSLAGLVGGPPCQGFSCIGRYATRDPRNQLFSHFFRLVAETKPRFFLAENVPGILLDRYKHVRTKALARVADDYVVLAPLVVTASDWGAPTVRTRVFFVGYRRQEVDQLSEEDFAPPTSVVPVHVGEALKGLPTKVSPLWRSDEDGWRRVREPGEGHFASRLHGHVPRGIGNANALRRLREDRSVSGCLGTVHSDVLLARYATIKPGTRDEITKSAKLEERGFCPTLRAGTGSDKGRFQAVRPLHPTQNRVITPREAARLQGFPDWFQFSSTRWHSFRLIGNSVSPLVAERIFKIIRTAIET